ncbi:MAG: hypothetical protein AVDCRST_MAG19-4323, partial [uncultured Thermomicrobiales bacterium]
WSGCDGSGPAAHPCVGDRRGGPGKGAIARPPSPSSAAYPLPGHHPVRHRPDRLLRHRHYIARLEEDGRVH